jgi:hypothetical protein
MTTNSEMHLTGWPWEKVGHSLSEGYGSDMGKLVNTFSWSHSASTDFELCRRKRYWSKYRAWGGWERDAPPESRTAYRLNKMTNRFCLYGIAAEDAVMWMLKELQAGRTPTREQAYDTVARPLLRRAWDESKQKVWQRVPKAACLHEHYYPEFHSLSDREIMDQIAQVVKACLKGFEEHVLPRISDVTPEMEIPVGVVGKGDPEHFFFEGVKVYAIPDYVFVREGIWHILDWKSGSAKEAHREQVGLYALWAWEKHQIPPEKVVLSLEYLQAGEHQTFTVSPEDLETARERIGESVQDMSQYLVNADPAANTALPKPEWDLCYEPALCRSCEFFELCRPELEEVLGDEIRQNR